MRSDGTLCAMARSSSDFLKVTIPVNEIKRPSAIARCARSRPPVKQCSTAGKAAFPRFLFQYPRHVRIRFARVDDERQTGCARGGNVIAQALFLRRARA